MLYLRWLETARRHAAKPAIFAGTRVVSFDDLTAALAQRPMATEPVIARSSGVDFFVEILRAWRDGQPVIPVERDAPEPILQSVPPVGTALVKYTPGACGVPRGIFFDAGQVIADGERLIEAMELRSDVPTLAAISLAHSYGFSNGVLPLLLHGVPVCLLETPFPRMVEEIFHQHERLVVPAVPSIWRAWHRAGILKNAPIQLALSAGAPLSLELEREIFTSCGLKLRNFYGASECGGISLDGSDRPREVASDLGLPLPGVVVTVQKDRLLVKSSSVGTAYDVVREDDLLGDGIYLTRDLGFLDKCGKIHLTGNAGGAINVAGRKVSPAKVEAAILTTGLVEWVKVFGVASSDLERCQEIAAELVLKPGVKLDALKSAAVNCLQSWELPRKWKEI